MGKNCPLSTLTSGTEKMSVNTSHFSFTIITLKYKYYTHFPKRKLNPTTYKWWSLSWCIWPQMTQTSFPQHHCTDFPITIAETLFSYLLGVVSSQDVWFNEETFLSQAIIKKCLKVWASGASLSLKTSSVNNYGIILEITLKVSCSEQQKDIKN